MLAPLRLMPENSKRLFLVCIVSLPVIIFLYFLQCKAHVFYGDDLYTYSQYMVLKTFSEKINMSVAAEKFRPIQGMVLQLLIDTFGNNSNGYYWFNVLIQSINTLIFALVLNLYLQSPVLSIFIGLVLG